MIRLLLSYYYNIQLEQEISSNNTFPFLFKYHGNKYLIEKIGNLVYRESLPMTYENINIHSLIKNKYNNYITEHNGTKYVLLKINLKEENRKICLEDIKKLSEITIENLYIDINKYNYSELWFRKIKFMELYINDKCKKYKKYYCYYSYLARISANYVKTVNFKNITYGISFNRFDKIKSIYELYSPLNIKIGPIVNSISEYIKYIFFSDNVNYKTTSFLLNNMSYDDCKYLICRLLFPTYFFDFLKTDNNEKEFYNILYKQKRFLKSVNEIVNEIKKRYTIIGISEISEIINLL